MEEEESNIVYLDFSPPGEEEDYLRSRGLNSRIKVEQERGHQEAVESIKTGILVLLILGAALLAVR